MKYSSNITGWGMEAIGFLKELNYLIVFDDNAPPELAEISVLHEKSKLNGWIKKGDTLIIGKKAFDITAVGEEAQNTFRQMGHATLNFSGGEVPFLPGHIMLCGQEVLTEKDIQKGVNISIY
ncbi:PTS glucitol/sorbitol transporter subunit IIA [Pectinatus cerevisiiphilus]|uniref:PTS system glucitol/sorbitol-specific IIA component n=1 Tax=Pectinatus cerevisiiphilus TaxID=86956 RepID=A0A4R3K4V4_9FIRM|nr:PTS glucitol/sorbitol transporter subunit IIA [Pectinatus cerevisiiphilus]TCS77796.1 PTS system glucitol/sorbitol-specific IIA component [Pectinatus cerevisiiphilus]